MFLVTFCLKSLKSLNFAYLNRTKIVEKALYFAASNLLEEVFSSFPDAYLSNNRERVIKTLDDFTNASSANKISKEEFREIGSKTVRAIADRRLTYQEITEILDKMDEILK